MKELLEAIDRLEEAKKLELPPPCLKDLEWNVNWRATLVRVHAINQSSGYMGLPA